MWCVYGVCVCLWCVCVWCVCVWCVCVSVSILSKESNSELVFSHNLIFSASFLVQQMYRVGFVQALEYAPGQVTFRSRILCMSRILCLIEMHLFITAFALTSQVAQVSTGILRNNIQPKKALR